MLDRCDIPFPSMSAIEASANTSDRPFRQEPPNQGWDPKRHLWFPFETRQSIYCLLLCWNRHRWQQSQQDQTENSKKVFLLSYLPKEALFLVFYYLSIDTIVAKTDSLSKKRKGEEAESKKKKLRKIEKSCE